MIKPLKPGTGSAFDMDELRFALIGNSKGFELECDLSISPAALFSEKDGLMRQADKVQLGAEMWNNISDPKFPCVLPKNAVTSEPRRKENISDILNK